MPKAINIPDFRYELDVCIYDIDDALRYKEMLESELDEVKAFIKYLEDKE